MALVRDKLKKEFPHLFKEKVIEKEINPKQEEIDFNVNKKPNEKGSEKKAPDNSNLRS